MYIQKGPYLQDPKPDSIQFRWETDKEASSEVRVYDTYLAHVPAEACPIQGEAMVFTGEPGKFHVVNVKDLLPAHDYYYEVVSRGEEGTAVSEKLPFRTAPKEDTAVSFVLTAEYGGACKPQANPYVAPILSLIQREHPDFVLSVGDLVREGAEESDWQSYFFSTYKWLLRKTPFYPCVGNHEVSSCAVKDCEIATQYACYEKYFTFPRNYSFDYGCAHFCVLDCPSMFERIDTDEKDSYIPVLKDRLENLEAYRFLEKDLANTDAKWKFVVFHYPPYTSSIYDGRELRPLSALFEKYGVDIVFNSHAIVYERSHPIKKDKVAKDGVRYILVGGHGDYDVWFRPNRNGLAAKLGSRPNYVHVSLTPHTLELQAIDYEGKLFDMMVLEK